MFYVQYFRAVGHSHSVPQTLRTSMQSKLTFHRKIYRFQLGQSPGFL
jgi:hypothetical protein